MAWRRNLQVSSVGTSAERLGVGADHDGGRAAGAKGAATEETRKGLRLRILPGTGCHRAGPPSKSGARAGGGRSDDFTQSNCGGTEAELATSATTCLHPQPPSRAYICVRNHLSFPSGHTSNSFLWATVVSRHYGWKAGIPAFAAASYVGASRIASRKHFLTDVVAGATLGYIVGRTVTRDGRDNRDRRFRLGVAVPPGGGAAISLGIRAW